MQGSHSLSRYLSLMPVNNSDEHKRQAKYFKGTKSISIYEMHSAMQSCWLITTSSCGGVLYISFLLILQVFLATFMNLASACLAITAIVLYTVNLVNMLRRLWYMCETFEPATYNSRLHYDYNDDGVGRTLSTETVRDEHRRTNFEICQSTRNIVLVGIRVQGRTSNAPVNHTLTCKMLYVWKFIQHWCLITHTFSNNSHLEGLLIPGYHSLSLGTAGRK